MARYTTPSLVVRTVDYGEADRIVTLLTREHGKLAAIARAARKSTRRFGAGLSLFGIGEATLSERPGAELATLEAFDGARGFPALMLDVAKVAHGGYACELVRELLPLRQPEPEVFELVVELLDTLERTSARAETLRAFELKLLSLVGLQPTLDRCVRCGDGELDAPGQLFAARRGGVVCGACQPEAREGRPLDGAARAALLALGALALPDAAGSTLAPAVNAACREALSSLITEQLGRPLKSLEFIHKLNQAAS